jgi:hypothetical protein
VTLYRSCEFPFMGDSETVETVVEAVAARRPFSLIRVGDGEAIVLNFDQESTLYDLAYLHGHWGTEGVTLRAVDEVRQGLEEALRGADIVGVRDDILNVAAPAGLMQMPAAELHSQVTALFPIRPEEAATLSPLGARRIAMLHHVLSEVDWAPDQRFCSAWIHWELLASGALGRILEQVDEVGLVTARPELEVLVHQAYGIRTRSVLVPDKHVEVPGSGLHVPLRYRTIRAELDFPPGSLVLVGAGIPGKVYCNWLKESGCVAVDVGAVFDAWVGKASRPRVLESRFKVAGGDRVPDELRLRPGTAAGRRVLTPRWKAAGVEA